VGVGVGVGVGVILFNAKIQKKPHPPISPLLFNYSLYTFIKF